MMMVRGLGWGRRSLVGAGGQRMFFLCIYYDLLRIWGDV